MVGLLGVAAALEEEQQVLVPGGHAGVEHRLDARADVVPDLGPHLAGRPAQRPRVLGLQGVAHVGVVVEGDELRAPRRPHGEPRRQHDADGVAQRRRARCRAARAASAPSRGPPSRGRASPPSANSERPAVRTAHRCITRRSLGGARPDGARPVRRRAAGSATRPAHDAVPASVCARALVAPAAARGRRTLTHSAGTRLSPARDPSSEKQLRERSTPGSETSNDSPSAMVSGVRPAAVIRSVGLGRGQVERVGARRRRRAAGTGARGHVELGQRAEPGQVVAAPSW